MTGSNFSVFVAGGTGYLGLPLLRELLKRGHAVRALCVREVKRNCRPVAKPFKAMPLIPVRMRATSGRHTHLCNWWAFLILIPGKLRNFRRLTVLLRWARLRRQSKVEFGISFI